jgi:hypothetical protein
MRSYQTGVDDREREEAERAMHGWIRICGVLRAGFVGMPVDRNKVGAGISSPEEDAEDD